MKRVLTVLMVLTCTLSVIYADLNEGLKNDETNEKQLQISVVNIQAINVRKDIAKNSEILGKAYNGYTYNVTDKYPTYYKIKLPNSKQGWIYANTKNNWTSRLANAKVKVLHNEALSVSKKPFDNKSKVVGYAAPGFEFEIMDIKYSYLKIALPQGIEGWIYCGKPGQSWIEFKR